MNLTKIKHNSLVDYWRLGFDRLNIQLHGKLPPIVVLSMPKTGGTTIHHTVQSCVRNPVFHIHCLSADNAQHTAKVFREKRGGAPYHVAQAGMLRKFIERSEGKRVKVICVVREPVARFVFLFFQTGKAFHESFLDSDGNYRLDVVGDHLSEVIKDMSTREESREIEWFRTELLEVLGINVFDQAFDQKTGFVTCKNGSIELVVIRLETLDGCVESALKPFLETKNHLRLVTMNQGNSKQYAAPYKAVSSGLRFPLSVLREIYSDEFVKHFYTSEMIDNFISRWVED